MSRSKELIAAYTKISSRDSQLDTIEAWGEFEDRLAENPPDLDVLLAMDGRVAWAAADVDKTRQLAVDESNLRLPGVHQAVPFFRGSGIVISASAEKILAVSYSKDMDGQDLVAEQYPNYQWVALQKVGRAALLANILKTPDSTPGKSFETLQQIMRLTGRLAADAPPHHAGYDFEVPFLGNEFTAAGASGMLPSEAVHEAMRKRYDDILVSDRQKGWVEWEHDEFAGYHDLVAANQVTSRACARQACLFNIVDLAGCGFNPH